ncbi:MAG: ABC transporter permease [Pseudomonadota bacterium]
MDSGRKASFILLAPPALFAAALLGVPLSAIFAISFASQDFLSLDWTPTFANYREALTEPIYRELLFRSLLVAGAATAATVALAFPVAYFVSFHVSPSRKALWLFLITVPFWTSYLIRVFLWKVILGFNGVINASLLEIGLIEAPLGFLLYNPAAVIITLAHAYAPFAILPVFVALERVDRSYLEAARDLGETGAGAFRRITLPLAAPGIAAAALVVFIPTMGDYVTPRLVGGPDGLMIANMIQVQFMRLNNAPLGAALAVLAMGSVALAAFALAPLSRRAAQ